MPSSPSDPATATDNALDKVHFEPVPGWVQAHEAPAEVVRKDGDVLTQLLIDQQHDRASRSVFEHRVIRLESMDAVQHLSQWTLDFSPLTETVFLHDLTVIRGNERKQYALRENIRLLNRERNLEAFIVDGMSTLLIVLADIRVGDIIDQSLTIRTKPHLLEEEFFHNYALPQQTQIGSFHFSVKAPAGQLPAWRGSASMGEPESSSDGETECLTWRLESVSRFESEPNVPTWYMPPAWLQFSSIASWEAISRAAAKAWPACGDDSVLDDYLAGVKAEHEALEAQIEAVLRYLQDEFRYLSLNETFGGQIPAPPDTVLGRRYGDCKDLSLLLTELLKRLGVEARPVVVNQAIGRTLPDMLPSLNLFNHAIVSFFHEGEEYWVDPTISTQGGGPFKRFVGHFTHGLPIDGNGCGLTPQPEIKSPNTYQLHDTLLLDTAGGHSLIRVQLIATGWYADNLRSRLHGGGEEGFRQDLLNRTQERYKAETLPDKPVYEDDRETNLWRMVELYQLPKLQGSQQGFYGVNLPDCLPLMMLPYPDDKKRQAPFAVPDHVDIKHAVEIHSSSNRRQPGRSEHADFQGVDFRVDSKFGNKIWRHTVALKTTTDHLTPDHIAAFRSRLRRPMQEAGLGIQVAKGHRRMRRGDDFMSLLPPPGVKPPARAGAKATIGNKATEKSDAPPASRRRRRSSSGRRRRSSSHHHVDDESPAINPWVIGIIVVVVIKVVIFLLKSNDVF